MSGGQGGVVASRTAPGACCSNRTDAAGRDRDAERRIRSRSGGAGPRGTSRRPGAPTLDEDPVGQFLKTPGRRPRVTHGRSFAGGRPLSDPLPMTGSATVPSDPLRRENAADDIDSFGGSRAPSTLTPLGSESCSATQGCFQEIHQ